MLLIFEREHYGRLGQKPYGSQVGLLLPWHRFRHFPIVRHVNRSMCSRRFGNSSELSRVDFL